MALNKWMIAEGGLELLAKGGLENLSIRKLADHFGIKSASLYYHFRNKQQLLDHVADVMVRPAWREVRDDESWDEWLPDVAFRLRRQILAFPDGALLYAGASPPADLLDERLALLYAPFLKAGMSREVVRRVILTFIRFTIGWATDEQVADDRGVGREAGVSDIDFEFGLRTIVLGVKALLDQSRPSS
ncbi:MAG TPA: TetR family transcriptional regulator [Sphingobium sp.]|nr:TetR family transcriptional regulator [Sphingobium sp.]